MKTPEEIKSFTKNLLKDLLWIFAPLALLLIGIGLIFLGPSIGWNSVSWIGLILTGISVIWGFFKWIP